MSPSTSATGRNQPAGEDVADGLDAPGHNPLGPARQDQPSSQAHPQLPAWPMGRARWQRPRCTQPLPPRDPASAPARLRDARDAPIAGFHEPTGPGGGGLERVAVGSYEPRLRVALTTHGLVLAMPSIPASCDAS